MKIGQAVKVLDWTRQHKSDILQRNTRMAAAAELATAELGFKVSTASIGEAFDECGIPRQRSRVDAKLQGIRNERDAYRTALLSVLAYAPGEQLVKIREDLAFDEQIGRHIGMRTA